MLHGFGQAPVCLELDLDSYDGPWTHVERFRGQSGWLVVAEAHVSAGDDEWTTSIVAACDDHGDRVPAFMAPNLAACACSLPAPCNEIPPDALEELLGEAAHELKLKWLRDGNAALARLAESTAEQIAVAESRTRAVIEEIDRRIADLQRRRRMLGMADAARAVFHDAIVAFELEREMETEQLTAQQRRMRRAIDNEERALIRRTGVHVTVEPLYHVRWSAAARFSEEVEWARTQAGRRSDFHPYALCSRVDELLMGRPMSAVDNVPQTLSAGRRGRSVARNDLDAELRVALARTAMARAAAKAAETDAYVDDDASRVEAPPPSRTVEVEKLEDRATTFASIETSVPSTIRISTPVATTFPAASGKLRLERETLSNQLAELEIMGHKFLNGSPKFKRIRDLRDELAARIRTLDAHISALSPDGSAAAIPTVSDPADLTGELADRARFGREEVSHSPRG